MSKTTELTPKEIIQLREKYPDESLLVPQIKQTKKNKNKDFPTSYVPYSIKRLVGSPTTFRLKFTQQLLAANAKIPFGTTVETAKDMRITFRRLTKEDLKDTDYPPDKHDALLASNDEFIKALDIFADEYEKMAEKYISGKNTPQFRAKGIPVASFRQTHRKPTDQELLNPELADGIPLENPFYRFRVSADPVTKELGNKSTDGKLNPVVFDVRKTTKENGMQKFPARLIKGKTKKGKHIYTNLTVANGGDFMTYMSLVTGVVTFDSACISRSAVSSMNRVNNLYVWPHQVMKRSSIDPEDVESMAMFGTNNFNDEMHVDMPKEETKSSNKTSNNSDEESLSELEEETDDPEENNTSEPEENNDADDEPNDDPEDETDNHAESDSNDLPEVSLPKKSKKKKRKD